MLASVHPVRMVGWVWMARCLFGVWLGALCSQASGAVAGISIRRIDSSVTLEWPSELGWVQVQRATVLSSGASGAWADLGVATSETVMQESLGSGVAFYRLRFLFWKIRRAGGSGWFWYDGGCRRARGGSWVQSGSGAKRRYFGV